LYSKYIAFLGFEGKLQEASVKIYNVVELLQSK